MSSETQHEQQPEAPVQAGDQGSAPSPRGQAPDEQGSERAVEAGAAASPTAEQAETAAAEQQADAGQRRAPRIRIGSQRDAYPTLKARPQPQPLHPGRPEVPGGEAQPAERREERPRHKVGQSQETRPHQGETAAREAARVADSTAHAESTAAEAPVVSPESGEPHPVEESKQPGAATAPREQKREERGGGRSRRPREIEAPLPQSKVEKPNIRAELPEDLQAELEAALGEASLDEILTTRGARAAEELGPETRHTGRVAAVHRDSVFVELGERNQGVIPLTQFEEPPEIGMMLEAVVHRFNQEDGLYELTLPGGAVDIGNWSELREGLVVEARITGHNKGGLECEVSGIRGFIPASQISLYRVEDLSQFVGQQMNCVVTEANREQRNLVLSRRAVLEREQAEAKQKLLSELAPGQTREGTVRSLQNFGAFVDLGGVDGLIHISQLSWDRVRHASEVLEVGQRVKVKIQKMDPATGKISLGFRDLSENPWARVSERYLVGRKVAGTVSRITEFGAFVRLEAGIEGLIHISELAHKRIWRASDVVQEGQEVEVQIVSVDATNQRIGLSLKALQARAVPQKTVEEEEPEEAPVQPRRKSNVPLKGGLGRGGGGEQFGLKW